MIRKLLDEFLESTRTTLKDLDDPTLDQLFASASTTRGEIPRDTKGFLTKLWDVLGLGMPELMDRLLAAAFERHDERRALDGGIRRWLDELEGG